MKYFRNKYGHYTVSDFLLDDSFIQWIRSGKPRDHVWAERTKDSDKLRFEAEEAEKVLSNLKPTTGKKDPQQVAELKSRILQKVESFKIRDQFGTYKPKTFRNHYLRYAAAIALLIAISGAFYYSLVSNSEPVAMEVQAYEIRKTKSGQKLTIHLSDGSTVKLNSESEIRYQKHFGNKRVIHLVQGEAFFEVAEDKRRPFRVITGNTTTEALGTSFNVKIVEDNLTRIALVTGRVKVSNNQNKEVLLNPGNLVACNTTDFSAIEDYEVSEISWKDEILIFNDDSGTEIVSKLEKWYGVKIQSNLKNLDNWKYSGRFENQNLYQVLVSIGAVEKFEFNIQDDIVIINPKASYDHMTN